MADDLGGRLKPGDREDPERPDDPGAEPPPLASIRVKGPRPKGLNKPAIIAVAGGGAAIILVLASGAFGNDASRRPAETRPMMSDPARPEMAKGAVRDLPATYSEAGSFLAASQPATPPPQLGPPLPGDIAAFAPDQFDDQLPPDPSWNGQPSYSATTPPDPIAEEAALAERSDLFFSLREKPQQTATQAAVLQQRSSPLTALGRAPDDQQSASPAAERTLFPGAVIPASLITEINSESPGPVIAQVTQSIYDSATGRSLLIPQGARLIGDYKSAAKYGQSRLAILWSRLIMPDGAEIALDEAATDPSGAAGVAGKVDNHWAEVFGAAALGTLINIGVATTEDTPQLGLTYGGIGITARDPVDQAIAQGTQRTASIVTHRVVDRALAIPPTIRIEAGKRISVISTKRIQLQSAS